MNNNLYNVLFKLLSLSDESDIRMVISSLLGYLVGKGKISVDELDELISTALDIIANPKKYAHACEGQKLATLFFEPSTRTRLSFEAAMYELG